MFTVLIAEKEHIDSIQQENKLFFEPFLENKELAFCCWNPEGQNLHDSVPGLSDVVGRRKEWRAVIIKNSKDAILKAQNPFDVVDYTAVTALSAPSRQPDANEIWDDWENKWKSYFEAEAQEKETVYKSAMEYPLQKLTTWLCFRPEDYILNETQEKQEIYDAAAEEDENNGPKPSIRLEILERNQYKKELRMKEMIRRSFVDSRYLNIAYPKEVFCISERTSDNGYFDPDKLWNERSDMDYSSFADRNMYFDKMRFMVFDLLPKDHRDYRVDRIRFLASVLIFISNSTPIGAMQPRRLYQMQVETDDTPLMKLVTSYDKKLAATYDAIDSEMEQIRNEIPGELTDKAAEALFCMPKIVEVLMDESCDPQAVYVPKDYGLSSDCPENELDKWRKEQAISKKELTYIIKQQARSVRKSVDLLQQASEISEINISRITPFQMDDIREYTEAAEDEMVASIPSGVLDISCFEERIKGASDRVKKILDQRMTKKTTLILGIIGLALYFICFLPFIVSNHGTQRSVSAVIVILAGVMTVLIAIMLISLLVLRSSLKDAVRSYNNTIHDIMAEVQAVMKNCSAYLSASCSVRRGLSVQNYAKNNIDVYTKRLRIRKKHQEDIRKRRAQLWEKYQDFFGGSAYYDETMVRPYELDFDQKTEYTYPAPFLSGDFRQIEFVSIGNFVTVPCSFVTKILISMEGIYDK